MKNHKHKALAIGGTCDHVHVLLGLNPTQAISNLMMNGVSNTKNNTYWNELERGCTPPGCGNY